MVSLPGALRIADVPKNMINDAWQAGFPVILPSAAKYCRWENFYASNGPTNLLMASKIIVSHYRQLHVGNPVLRGK
jgi:hypothetical protein